MLLSLRILPSIKMLLSLEIILSLRTLPSVKILLSNRMLLPDLDIALGPSHPFIKIQ